MKTMNFIVWMLPVIFMLHDFEEIIMAEVWGLRYKTKINKVWPGKQPFGLNYIRHCHTPTFSIGVEIEFVLFVLISFLSVALDGYFIWYGAFLGLVIHMIVIHMPICFRFKNYVPGVITSVIFLIPSIYFLYRANISLHYGTGTILLACLFGIVMIGILIPLLHKLMAYWSEWLYRYSEEKMI
ncbi:Protein of unknown function with HXXEE motif-containing protein [Anaerocolumna jejuensis DSM 15929]|uniref:HXXEE domain-containing protein n=1 Tax=Anaerocolumna jejuensis DSM 15929 TaxID=1121322 RepID=A0A1M6Y410_9FIRM|nr:HXXEE domain-containing protein [Anaerocolumna jejuensis]SHL12956.1 Protein of unknown function with HXXEE motif-containing protein [Anaerocolumna jejuensis DSM 15929]